MPQKDALNSLVDGEVHFALFSFPSDAYPDIEAVRYLSDPIVLIAPLDHPWAQCDSINIDELVEGDFIQRELGSGTLGAVREALAERDISINDLHVVITLGNSEAIAMAVQEGIGVAFALKDGFRSHLPAGCEAGPGKRPGNQPGDLCGTQLPPAGHRCTDRILEFLIRQRRRLRGGISVLYEDTDACRRSVLEIKR